MKPNPEEDKRTAEAELLAIRCQLGEAQAFDQLVERWHGPLWRFVVRMMQDPAAAEELMQDIWLRILRGLPGLRNPAKLVSWMFSIARRAVMDRLRRRYAEADWVSLEDEPVDPVSDSATGQELALTQLESLEQLHDAVAELALAERETVTLFYLHELSLQEVAEVLEIPVGTVKSRLHRARTRLRRALLSEGDR
ncbi:MAG: RNA polymerase sigma factor [Acidobacteriota bacterium]|nr:RNA polymerase sigma factor [Acidobacteriota bacterium]